MVTKLICHALLTCAAIAVAALAMAQVPPTPASVAAGQQLYLKNCASCHGRTGDGGPGNDLIPAAPSLIDDQWDHGASDKDVFDSIKNGVAPDFNMVPFKDKLKDDEIWNVVSYLRSIAKKK